MIILLDVKEQNILLYKKDGLVKIPFSEASTIVEYMGENNKITYITNAIKVSSVDIINLIKSLGIKVHKLNNIEISKNKYLCGTVEGIIPIDENLQFRGKYDCKLIDNNMRKVIRESPLLQKLIENKKIEIIGELKKNNLLKELKVSQKGILEKQSKRDESLNKIIMDTKISDWDGSIVGDDDEHDSAIVIDLEKGGRTKIGGGVSVNTMSELMEQIEGE